MSLILVAALMASALLQGQTVEPRLMRLPSVRGDTVVFTYAGDLWVTHTSGGIARRLTSSPGVESYPQISPDGKTVAFSGQYEGFLNIYTVPSRGGRTEAAHLRCRRRCMPRLDPGREDRLQFDGRELHGPPIRGYWIIDH